MIAGYLGAAANGIVLGLILTIVLLKWYYKVHKRSGL